MGSQINERQLERFLSYVEINRKQEGARLICGGERITDGELAKAASRPTLLADVTNDDMRVAQEEIFGPVACILKFRDEDEVIRMSQRQCLRPWRRCLDPRLKPRHPCIPRH